MLKSGLRASGLLVAAAAALDPVRLRADPAALHHISFKCQPHC